MEHWEGFTPLKMLDDKTRAIQFCDKQVGQFEEFLETAKSPMIIKDEYARQYIETFASLVEGLKGIYRKEQEVLRSLPNDESITEEENRSKLYTLAIDYYKLSDFENNILMGFNKFINRSKSLSPYIMFREDIETLEHSHPKVANALSYVSGNVYHESQKSGVSMVEDIKVLERQFEVYKNGEQVFAHDYVPSESKEI
jgi:hypothetical protein